MFSIDGKELDLTKPLVNITIKEGGYIEQSKDGQTVRLTKEDLDKEARIETLEAK